MDILDTRENLNAMVLCHEQQIKDIAAHLLELKRLVTPMMEFKRIRTAEARLEQVERLNKSTTPDDDLNNVRYKANYRYETKQPLTDKEIIETCEPLYKKKEWVGLTDEDIKDIVGRNDSGSIGAYTREMFKQIEDKLREKNCGND